jgi:hypothetical protein
MLLYPILKDVHNGMSDTKNECGIQFSVRFTLLVDLHKVL